MKFQGFVRQSNESSASRSREGVNQEEDSRFSPLDGIVKKWQRLDLVIRITAVYLVSVIVFLLCFENNTYLLLPIRFVTGILSMLILPGAIVGLRVVPERLTNLGTSIVLSIMMVLIGIQLAVCIALLIDFHVPIAIWINTINVILTIVTLFGREEGTSRKLMKAVGFEMPREIVFMLVGALALRILLTIFAQGAIAPDASLYSDYARNMINNDFNSNVLNDGTVRSAWNNVEYISHQSMAYLFAVSWLIIPPSTMGPTFILLVLGTVMILPTYSITERFFGGKAARIVAGIYAIHPLYVFHSTVGYGPEITSLFLLLFSAIFLFAGREGDSRVWMLSGVLLGLVDTLWYPNFYVACILFPAVFLLVEEDRNMRFLSFAGLMALVLVARVFYQVIPIYYGVWIGIFLVMLLLGRIWPSLKIWKLSSFFAGIFVVLSLWRWPLQIIAQTSTSTGGSSQSVVSAILAPLTFDMVLKFVSFLVFHLSVPLILLLILGLWKGAERRTAILLVAASTVGALGTLKIFGYVTGSLEFAYLYSDSRFFLAVVLIDLIALGSIISKYRILDEGEPFSKFGISLSKKQTRFLLVTVIIIGFVPSYFFIPSGLGLIDIEERYGWQNLPQTLENIGTEESRFLVDRAREFAWFTARNAVVLKFTNESLPLENASKELLTLAETHEAEFILIDDYTLARWRMLEFLLRDPISLGESFILNASTLNDISENTTSIEINALTLVGQSDMNSLGRFSRVFRFDEATFDSVGEINLLTDGWAASNGGAIANTTEGVRITIGLEGGYTNTWRTTPFDLGLVVEPGFIVFDIQDVSATLVRIEIWNSDGILLRYAEPLLDGSYMVPLGQVTIGDIRIVIEGEEGDSVIVSSIDVWANS